MKQQRHDVTAYVTQHQLCGPRHHDFALLYRKGLKKYIFKHFLNEKVVFSL